MQTSKKIMFFLDLTVLVSLLSGCVISREAVEFAPEPDPRPAHQNSPVARRFEESAPYDLIAEEPAIELSKKYAELSDEASVLRQKNQDLITENRQLEDRLAVLEPRLHQAQKELNEANDLLREMLIELNNWKSNVMGFRQEIRGAEKAQLETLLKILKVLGGEIEAESAEGQANLQNPRASSDGSEDAASTALSANKPAPPQLQETSAGGKPNE